MYSTLSLFQEISVVAASVLRLVDVQQEPSPNVLQGMQRTVYDLLVNKGLMGSADAVVFAQSLSEERAARLHYSLHVSSEKEQQQVVARYRRKR